MASSNPLLDSLTYVIKCCNDKGARSNFNKTLQYATKLGAIELKESDPKSALAKDLTFASGAINSARKLSQLGNFLEIFTKLPSLQWTSSRHICKNLADVFNGLFLLFDNFVILNRIKLTEVLATNGLVGKLAMCAFWFSQLFGLIVEIMDYKTMLREHSKSRVAFVGKELRDKDEAHRSKVFWTYLGFVARFGNMTYSANGWDLSENLLGAPFSERTCAWAGLISGMINMVKAAQTVNSK